MKHALAYRFGRNALLAVLAIVVFFALILGGFRKAADMREVAAFADALPEDGRLVDTAEGAIFLIEAGRPDAPQVLFAHGSAAWSGLWRPTLQATAAAGFRAAAFDMPPFGWSEHPAGDDCSRTRQAERVIALLEALGTRPIAAAHSVGAGPVAEAILRRPDLASGLIIVDGVIALGGHDAPRRLPLALRHDGFRAHAVAATASNPYLTGRFLRSFIHVKDAATPELIALLQQPMRRIGYAAALNRWLPQLFETPANALNTRPDNWRALRLPIALIWGREDTVTPPAQAKALAALAPGARTAFLDGVGHIPQIEAPESFQAALLRMLEAMADQTAGATEG